MIRILFDLGLFGLLTSTIFAILVVAGLLRFLTRRRAAPLATAFSPAVSLLKPVDGAEPGSSSALDPQRIPGWKLRVASPHVIRRFPRDFFRPAKIPTLMRRCLRLN
jgi:hypothetical protein